MKVKTRQMEWNASWEERKALAEKAWTLALADMFAPPLPEPQIIEDERTVDAFQIDTNSWTVTLNLAAVPKNLNRQDFFSFLRGISRHEMEHYITCPYDGPTSALLLQQIIKAKGLQPELILNIFADFICDTDLLSRFEEETVDLLNKIIEAARKACSRPSVLWMVIVKTYDLLWKDLLDENQVKIEGLRFSDFELKAARDLARVLGADLLDESTWLKKIRKFTKIINRVLKKSSEEKATGSSGTPSGGMTAKQQGRGKSGSGKGRKGGNNKNDGRSGGENGASKDEDNGKGGKNDQCEPAGGQDASKQDAEGDAQGKSNEVPEELKRQNTPLGTIPDDVRIQMLGDPQKIRRQMEKSPEDREKELETIAERFIEEQVRFDGYCAGISILFQGLKLSDALRYWYRAQGNKRLKVRIHE
ncbi:MAG: hypothetical protein ACXQS8_07320, partial [Candidatus Helarchaeales archaeon]